MGYAVTLGIGLTIGVWIGVIVMALPMFKIASDYDDLMMGDKQYDQT